jgi:hypothetical protein
MKSRIAYFMVPHRAQQTDEILQTEELFLSLFNHFTANNSAAGLPSSPAIFSTH